jgi:anti-sigma-K factor RskA
VNVKEYISSGVVENYVLGLATEAERQEFETACRQHPEVLQARVQFEQRLEAQLLQDAPPLPDELKKRIIGSIGSLSAQPATKTVETAPVRRMPVWKIAAAASVAALVGVLFWAISLNTRNQQLRNENAALQRRADSSTAQLAQLQQDAQRMQGPGVKLATMKGTPKAPNALATVYWDTTNTDVYIMINNLPQPASDKQYQLWALLNGKPIDLGVFELKQQQLLVKMRNVQNAQAFAVTLEPKGGSAAPTMEALYVVGEL